MHPSTALRINQSTTFSPHYAKATLLRARLRMGTARGRQSRNTRRSLATPPVSLHRKGRILVRIERYLAKLFLDGA